MFGSRRQRQSLSQVPLKQFEEVLAYRRGIEGDAPVTLLAHGKGTAYAPNPAVRYDATQGLVLLTSAAHSFCGLRIRDHGSNWTWEKKDVPLVDQKRSHGFAGVLWPLLMRGIVRLRGAGTRIQNCGTSESNEWVCRKRVRAIEGFCASVTA